MYPMLQFRRTVLSAMYALALFSLPVGLAHAADSKPFNPVKEGCTGAGYTWSDTQGCANKPCKNWFFGTGSSGRSDQAESRGGAGVLRRLHG